MKNEINDKMALIIGEEAIERLGLIPFTLDTTNDYEEMYATPSGSKTSTEVGYLVFELFVDMQTALHAAGGENGQVLDAANFDLNSILTGTAASLLRDNFDNINTEEK